MAKHVHIYLHKRPTADKALLAIAAGKGNTPMRTRDSDDYEKLLDVLFEAIKDHGGVTQDAGFDESKVKRDAGGKFSHTQHAAASKEHEKQANAHYEEAKKATTNASRAAHTEAYKAHMGAANHHEHTKWSVAEASPNAHLDANKAHAASAKAIEATKHASRQSEPTDNEPSSADYEKHREEYKKATTATQKADPNSIEELRKKFAPQLAAQNARMANGGMAPGVAGFPSGGVKERAQIKSQQPASPAAPAASDKPTKATAKGRAGAHELLKSGHSFTVEEMMEATGTPRSTMLTVLSSLKNPKYAGKLGTLDIVKGKDGSYSVVKKLLKL